MNYNFSNNFNSVQILPSKQKNSLNEAQVLLLLISTALKQSLAVYQMHWKPSQNHLNPSNQPNIEAKKLSGIYIPQKKMAQEKHLNVHQQNKKCMQKTSYNSKIQKNDKIQSENRQKDLLFDDKNCSEEQKLTAIYGQQPKTKRQKVIHQKNSRETIENRIISSIKNGSFVDLDQGADIPRNDLSHCQIQQKRQKLLLRKVFNWKQIDKKVGFRKMELKKLLS